MEPPPSPRKPNLRTKNAWKKLAEGDWEAEKLAIAELNRNLSSALAPGTLEKYRQLELNWECFMSLREPDLPKNNIWHSDVVKRNIMHFLPRIVSNQPAYISSRN